MESLRVGGIVSGLDTNGIVEMYTAQAKLPLDRLESKYDLKTLEKDLYQSIDTQLDKIKSNLLNLRFESTFKTKSMTSSNSSILSASADVNAAAGSYSVEILQTASQSYWTSNYTSISGVQEGAGVDSISGTPTEHLQGTHTIDVDVTSTPKTMIDTFTPNNLGSMEKVTGSNNIANITNGELSTNLAGDFSVTIDSVVFTSTITAGVGEAGESGNDINEVMNFIDSDLNDQLNTHFGTTDLNYISMRADYSGGNWQTSIYKTSLESYSIEAVAFTADAGEPTSDLGVTTTVSTTATSITKYYIDTDAADLLTKINDSDAALIKGVSFNSTSGLEDGTLKLLQDSTLNTSAASSTQRTGNTASSGGGLTTTVVGLENAGFLNTANSDLNGTFTINNVEITIDDYTAVSVNDILAQINSSNAGVIATYNATDDQIILTSNETGAESISLGDYSDTSNILSLFRLSAAEGATTVTGTDSGSIDSSTKLSDAGFSNTITSGVFTINGVSIYVDASEDSLDDVMAKVNNSGAGITMGYDKNSDRVTIKSDGKERIAFGASSDTSSFLEAVKLTNDTTTEKTLGYEGQDAIIKVDGVTYLRESNKINDVITGVTLNLNASSSETVNITIGIDNSKGVSAIASFIQQYNEMMELLDAPDLSSDEEDYLVALTDDAKASMSSDEIDDYNEKWKEYNEYNLINRSSELRSLRNSMRSTATGSLIGVDSKFENLSQVGIDIAGGSDYDVLNKGMLLIDSTDYDEIMEALEDNSTLIANLDEYSDDIYNFFAQNESTDTEEAGGSFDSTGKGWAKVYENHINSYIDDDGTIGIKIKTGGTLDMAMDRILKDYESQEMRVEQYLERLWAQFSAMESTIASIQEQSSSLTSLTGA